MFLLIKTLTILSTNHFKILTLYHLQVFKEETSIILSQEYLQIKKAQQS